jgi:hypothetical protein
VQQIEHDAADPVRNRRTDPAHEDIRDRAEGSEQQSKHAGYDHPDNRMLVFAQQKHGERQNAPDIKVVDPPYAKTVNQSFR